MLISAQKQAKNQYKQMKSLYYKFPFVTISFYPYASNKYSLIVRHPVYKKKCNTYVVKAKDLACSNSKCSGRCRQYPETRWYLWLSGADSTESGAERRNSGRRRPTPASVCEGNRPGVEILWETGCWTPLGEAIVPDRPMGGEETRCFPDSCQRLINP